MNDTRVVRQFVVDHFLFGDDAGLEDNTPFFERGILDSTGILDLVAFVEKTWGISVADDELVPDNFSNLERIGHYVERKTGGTTPCVASPVSAI